MAHSDEKRQNTTVEKEGARLAHSDEKRQNTAKYDRKTIALRRQQRRYTVPEGG